MLFSSLMSETLCPTSSEPDSTSVSVPMIRYNSTSRRYVSSSHHLRASKLMRFFLNPGTASRRIQCRCSDLQALASWCVSRRLISFPDQSLTPRFTLTDMCELARNSCAQSGFEMEIKRHWLGPDWYKVGVHGNLIHKTNVPNLRAEYRQATLMEERDMVSRQFYRLFQSGTLLTDSLTCIDRNGTTCSSESSRQRRSCEQESRYSTSYDG